MLLRSQPLSIKAVKKLGLNSEKEILEMSEGNIKSQRIGRMFDDIDMGNKKSKISLQTRLGWKWRDLKGSYYDVKYTIRNHFKWCKTIGRLRPWEGFDGLLRVMIKHLYDYVETEEKYGHSEESYKKQKIDSAKEVIKILKRMKNPEKYASRRRKKVEEKYPKYKQLLTEYKNGGSGSSGYFVAQGNGWAGKESGKDPREGYFEFIDGRFELVNSPDQGETDRLLNELCEYNKEIDAAYRQAEIDSDKDFEKLGQLLKENLYKWWD